VVPAEKLKTRLFPYTQKNNLTADRINVRLILKSE
jgi:hypothetical protein